ncbi:MAG: hypothetical protein ACI86H_001507 [bacterium]|jgi:hypothetical protein
MVKKIGITFLVLTVWGLINLYYYIFIVEFRYRYIVIHHTASKVDNYQSIYNYHHYKKKWSDVAYHMILSNGSTKVPLGHVEISNRYQQLKGAPATRSRYCNRKGIHIAVVGNFEENKVSQKMQKSIVSLLQVLQKRFHIPNTRVVMHRDCSDTLCPGKFISKEKIQHWLVYWKNKINPYTQQQHIKTVAGSKLPIQSLKKYKREFMLLNAGFWLLCGIILGIEWAFAEPTPKKKSKRFVSRKTYLKSQSE